MGAIRWLAISLLVVLCLAGCGGGFEMTADLGSVEESVELPPDAPTWEASR
jgi:hypothetical protein